MSGLYFVAAIAMTGLPPLSGFIGKLLILDGVRLSPYAPLIWATILITSLLVIVAFTRAGSTVFWKSRNVAATNETAMLAEVRQPVLPIVVVGTLLAGTAAITVFGGPVSRFLEATTDQLYRPQVYIATVLGQPTPPVEVRDPDLAAFSPTPPGLQSRGP